MRKFLSFLVLIHFVFAGLAQINNTQVQRLKVFIDCNNTFCDRNFIQTEINIVDFYLDNQAADLHVLITEQETGSGGRQYQLIFFGLNQFKGQTDTLRFSTNPDATQFENRDIFIKYLKLGLAPFIAKTASVTGVKIDMKQSGSEPGKKTDTTAQTKDPWNYWVFRVGINGHMDADAVYKSSRLSGDFSANRVTEEIKIGFGINGGKSKTSYDLEDSTGKEKIIIKNDDYNISQYLVKSLTDHWSYGYEIGSSRSSFSNNKQRLILETGIEYDIFPYKEVNTRFFTLSYVLDVRRNAYIDTTLYDKTKETLFGHAFNSNLSFKQKWGSLSFGIDYHNYLHNWKFFSLGIDTELDIRITGGLSFNFFAFGELSRDQIYLPREGATPEEILTRRRQIASGYRFFTHFGLNYRFGSKLNNFVNPRFD